MKTVDHDVGRTCGGAIVKNKTKKKKIKKSISRTLSFDAESAKSNSIKIMYKWVSLYLHIYIYIMQVIYVRLVIHRIDDFPTTVISTSFYLFYGWYILNVVVITTYRQ